MVTNAQGFCHSFFFFVFCTQEHFVTCIDRIIACHQLFFLFSERFIIFINLFIFLILFWHPCSFHFMRLQWKVNFDYLHASNSFHAVEIGLLIVFFLFDNFILFLTIIGTTAWKLAAEGWNSCRSWKEHRASFTLRRSHRQVVGNRRWNAK